MIATGPDQRRPTKNEKTQGAKSARNTQQNQIDEKRADIENRMMPDSLYQEVWKSGCMGSDAPGGCRLQRRCNSAIPGGSAAEADEGWRREDALEIVALANVGERVWAPMKVGATWRVEVRRQDECPIRRR